jgi:hypothetical protein
MNVWQLPIGGNKVGRVGRGRRARSAAPASARSPAQLRRRSLPQAAVLLSTCWLNSMLTGVAFCGPSHNDVAVAAYDTDELRVWRRA